MTIEKISIREFARRCGSDDRSVRDAIKRGYIKKGYDKKAKKIIYEEAYKEWGVKFKARKINAELMKVDTTDLDGVKNIPIEDITLKADDPQIVLERKHVFIKANRDLLKLKTESGELQNREDVYKELFEFGKEVRSALLNIPDRISDQLAVLANRNDVHKLLTESLTEVLVKLTNHAD